MPVYLYETLPDDPSVAPRRFEHSQSIKAAALTHDPVTGLPVRRVITGGLGYLGSRRSSGGMVAGFNDNGGTCCPGCHD